MISNNEGNIQNMSSREVKQVSFGKKDADLLEFLGDKGQFSKYVKQLIREEMERIEEAKKPKFVPIKQSTDEKIIEMYDKLDKVLSLLENGSLVVSNREDTTEATEEQKDELTTLSEGQKTALAVTDVKTEVISNEIHVSVIIKK